MNEKNLTAYSPQYEWIALGLMPLWTTISNGIVLFCFMKHRSLRQNLSNFIIASMALADMLLGIFVLPFAVYMKVVGCWGLGYWLKVVWFCIDVLLSAASITNLLAITVYRYLAIAYPYRFRYSASRSHIQTLLITAWSLAGLLSIAVFIETMVSPSESSQGPHENSCRDYMLGSVPFLVYGSLLSFFIPLLVMGFMAMRSIQLLKRKNAVSCGLHKVLRMTLETSTPVSDEVSQTKIATSSSKVFQINGSQSIRSESSLRTQNPTFNSNRRKSIFDKTITFREIIRSKAATVPHNLLLSTKEQRAIRTLLAVFGIFVICWFPFFTLQLVVAWSDVNSDLHIQSEKLLFDFAWPGYSTSVINPIIYAVVSLEFRRAFKTIFSHCFNKRKPFKLIFQKHRSYSNSKEINFLK